MLLVWRGVLKPYLLNNQYNYLHNFFFIAAAVEDMESFDISRKTGLFTKTKNAVDNNFIATSCKKILRNIIPV